MNALGDKILVMTFCNHSSYLHFLKHLKKSVSALRDEKKRKKDKPSLQYINCRVHKIHLNAVQNEHNLFNINKTSIAHM